MANSKVSSPLKSRSLRALQSKGKKGLTRFGSSSVAELIFFFTSTSLFVQEFVARRTITLITNSPVPADVGAATIVVCTLIQDCRERGSRRKGGGRVRDRREGMEARKEELNIDEITTAGF